MANGAACCCPRFPSNTTGTVRPSSTKPATRPACRSMHGGNRRPSRLLPPKYSTSSPQTTTSPPDRFPGYLLRCLTASHYAGVRFRQATFGGTLEDGTLVTLFSPLDGILWLGVKHRIPRGVWVNWPF